MLRPFNLERGMTRTNSTLRAIILAASLAVVASAGLAKEKAAKDDQNTKELFATTCGWCHEQGGRVAGKGPQLAGTKRSDSFIINRIKQGKEGAMPAFEGALTDRQIKGILRYIRGLKAEEQG
jgi:mono/diheme cytochrome c family protein